MIVPTATKCTGLEAYSTVLSGSGIARPDAADCFAASMISTTPTLISSAVKPSTGLFDGVSSPCKRLVPRDAVIFDKCPNEIGTQFLQHLAIVTEDTEHRWLRVF